jgi:diadenosine tetraphosphate (Ap4A) HIT family hydrolase
LVVPKRHIVCIRQLLTAEINSLFNTVKFVSEKLNKYLKPQGFNYGFNEGKVAGQEVEHFHFHILPRFSKDSCLSYHIFHGDPVKKKYWSGKKFQALVKEFRKIFK